MNTLSTFLLATLLISPLLQAATNDIHFIAFGDGGYHPDYPKSKHIKKPKTRQQFLVKEIEDWQEEHRPMSEFDHAPIHVYPGTSIATEKSGALAVGSAMATYCQFTNCEFAIQLGDNIYPNGAADRDGKDDQKRMDDLIYRPLTKLIKNQPELMIYSMLGNHDWKASREGVRLQTDWMAKHPNFYMDEKGYYSFKKGKPGNDVEFFVLETNTLLSGQEFYDIPLNPDGSETPLKQALKLGVAEKEEPNEHEKPVNGEDIKQLNWFKKAIKTSTAKWKIVLGHHILWSVGGSKYGEGRALRKLIMPTLCEYADAYVAGHEHDLEMLTDDCSTHGYGNKGKLPLVVSGAASKMRGQHSKLAAYQEQAYPQMDFVWGLGFVWGFASMTLDNDKDQIVVNFLTTPRNQSGNLVFEKTFTYDKRR